MSSGEVRKVSLQDIQLVQNLIERCLQLYMSQKEVVTTLLDQAKIEPGFTELVWEKLEKENQEFFKAYRLRLVVKDQILRFNELLQRQLELMQQMTPSGITSIPMANGSQISPMNQNSACVATEYPAPSVKTESIHQAFNANMANTYTNGASQLQQRIQNPGNMSAHARRTNISSNMILPQNSNMGVMQGLNGGMIKTEAGYAGNPPFIFGSESNVLPSRPAIGDASVSSFSSVESDSHLNDTILDAGTPSFGILGQIPRNFSLSDLTADFSNSSDILESYSRSPFLASEADNFMNLHGREHQGP